MICIVHILTCTSQISSFELWILNWPTDFCHNNSAHNHHEGDISFWKIKQYKNNRVIGEGFIQTLCIICCWVLPLLSKSHTWWIHQRRVTYIYVRKVNPQYFKWWFDARLVRSNYLNQWRLNVNWAHRKNALGFEWKIWQFSNKKWISKYLRQNGGHFVSVSKR